MTRACARGGEDPNGGLCLHPSSSQAGGQSEAAMAEPPKTSPPPTVDGMDGLYYQLAEIHAITAI
jgi:hypothetical protein